MIPAANRLSCCGLWLLWLLSTPLLAASLESDREQQWQALFQGCDLVDGQAYCAFHVDGWKFFAYADGGSPTTLLEVLEQTPRNLPLVLHGRLRGHGDITADIVLSRVELDPEGDEFAQLRARLQGVWHSSQDPLTSLEILGSEWLGLYAGKLVDYAYLQIARACESAPEGALYLRLVEPEARESVRCLAILNAPDDQLRLSYVGRGNTLVYRRPAIDDAVPGRGGACARLNR